MKTRMKQLLVLMTILIEGLLFAQSTEFTTTRRLGFNQSVKTQQVEIDSPENTAQLNLKILCSVEKGTVKIQIFNPSGKKEGEFKVEGTETESTGELYDLLQNGVSGEINKKVYDPEKGSWLVKFIPEKATGKVQIISKLYIGKGD
jgi:hypothetical protein